MSEIIPKLQPQYFQHNKFNVMKHILILMLVSLFVVGAQAENAGVDTHGLSKEDYDALAKAVDLVDKGLGDLAQPEFDRLVAENPDNYLAQYERLYSLCRQGKYDEVVKSYKKLLKHKEVTPVAYHLLGVALTKVEKRKEAAKVVKEGLKKFPDAGVLYMLAASWAYSDKDYATSIRLYNQGISRDPMFWKNYLLASKLLLQSKEFKAWGLVYAETAMLLEEEHHYEEHIDLASEIRDCYMECIHLENDSAYARFAPSREIFVDVDSKQAYPGFCGLFEGCADVSLSNMDMGDKGFTGSLSQLSQFRKGLVEAYYEKAAALYGNFVYLLPFQKNVIDAGFWEEYNYFLFGYLFPNEYNEWLEANPGKLNAFVKWYKDGRFVLDAEHSVGIDNAKCIVGPLEGITYMQAVLMGQQPSTGKELIDLLMDSEIVFTIKDMNAK